MYIIIIIRENNTVHSDNTLLRVLDHRQQHSPLRQYMTACFKSAQASAKRPQYRAQAVRAQGTGCTGTGHGLCGHMTRAVRAQGTGCMGTGYVGTGHGMYRHRARAVRAQGMSYVGTGHGLYGYRARLAAMAATESGDK